MDIGQESAQLRRGVILSYLTEAVDILAGLLYTPIMLSTLGQNEYGLYQLVASVVSYLSLIGLGFSSSYQRYYAKIKADDERQMGNLNGMFMLVFLIMSAVCLLFGNVIRINARGFFGEKLTEGEIEKARILLAILTVNMAFTFPNSLFTCNIIAHQEFTFQKLLVLFQKILNPLICLPLLYRGFDSIAIVSVATVLSVLVFISNIFFNIRKLKIAITFSNLDFRLYKELFGFTFFIFLNQIVNQINWNVDSYLLGRYCGTSAIAVYNIGGQLRAYYSQFSTAISNVYIPKVNEIVAERNDNLELTDLFIKVGKIQTVIVLLVASGFLLFGKQFIFLWAGNEYLESYYVAGMFFIVLIIPYIQNLGIEIQRAKNKHRVRSAVYLAMAVLNVIISIPLIKKYGVIGAAVGTVISILLCNIIFMNFYYHYYIGLNVIKFWKSILRLCLGSLPPIIIGSAVIRFLEVNNWVEFFSYIVIYTFLYLVSMFSFGLIPKEKQRIIDYIKSFEL